MNHSYGLEAKRRATDTDTWSTNPHSSSALKFQVLPLGKVSDWISISAKQMSLTLGITSSIFRYTCGILKNFLNDLSRDWGRQGRCCTTNDNCRSE